MSNSNLTKSINIRLTEYQYEALEMLMSLGYDRSKFIRLAIDEKLYRDYRKLLKQLRDLNSDKNIPDFAK